MSKRKMTNQEFIDYLISISFEEKELLETENILSKDERLFKYKDVSIFVHVSGTRYVYMDVESVSIEGKTPKQSINNALKNLRQHYELARNKLIEVKNNIKSLKSTR